MNVKIIYAHPNPWSYNKAILDNVLIALEEAGHRVDLLDLYYDDFNPVMTKYDLGAATKQKPVDPKIHEYQKRIENADHLIFIFPIWFESVPAILKGYIDKVFSNGWAYKSVKGKKMPVGQLTYLNATVITTMGVSKSVYRLFFNNAVKGVLINGCLSFCGVQRIKWIKLDKIQTISNEKRETHLKQIFKYMTNLS